MEWIFSIHSALFFIALSSWMLLFYQFSAERYGWRQGWWSLMGYYFLIGFVSLIVLFFLLPSSYDMKDIALLYMFSFFSSAIALQIGKEWSQIHAFIFLITGYILYCIN
jgi:hypothetical protein